MVGTNESDKQAAIHSTIAISANLGDKLTLLEYRFIVWNTMNPAKKTNNWFGSQKYRKFSTDAAG